MHSILSFIFTISLVVIIHELGHFAVAKLFNVSVEKFSVGFGRIVYKKKIGITEFSIRIIPLGGFVKFHEESKSKKLNLFEKISLFKKSLIVLAGPLINFIFAFCLLLYLNQGLQYNILPKITAINIESISSEIGFKVNDLITSINDKQINSVAQHNKALVEFANKDLVYKILRNNEKISITINKRKRLDLNIAKTRRGDINGLYFFPSKKNSLVIDGIMPNSPAEIANLKKDDLIVSVDGEIIYSVSDFVGLIKSKGNTEVNIKLIRDKELLSILVTPGVSRDNIRSIGVIGIKIKPILENKDNYINSFRLSNLKVISKSFNDVLSGISMVFHSFVNIITGNIDWRLLSGPISIAELSSETLSMGLVTYLSFLVFLNINIGFLNLLPIPTLDGGLLFFYCTEWVTGRPINKKKMIISQRLGVIILFLVFTLAVYNDVFNFMFN